MAVPSSLLACKVTKQTTETEGHQEELDNPKGEANRWQKPKVITVTNEDSGTVSADWILKEMFRCKDNNTKDSNL
jgi:hypothetical protein